MAGVIISPGQYYLGGNTFAGGTAEAFQRGAKSTQDMLAQQQTMEMGQFAEQRARTGEQRTQQKFPLDLEKLRADTEQARALSEQARATATDVLGRNRRADEKLAPEIEQLRAQAAHLRASAAVATSAEARATLGFQAEQAERYAEALWRQRNVPGAEGAPVVNRTGMFPSWMLTLPPSGLPPYQPSAGASQEPGQAGGMNMPAGIVFGGRRFQSGGAVLPEGAARPDGSFDPAPGLMPPGMYADLPAPQAQMSRGTAMSFTPEMVQLARNWNTMSESEREAAYNKVVDTIRFRPATAPSMEGARAYLPESNSPSFVGRFLPVALSNDAAISVANARSRFGQSMEELAAPPGLRTTGMAQQLPGGELAYEVAQQPDMADVRARVAERRTQQAGVAPTAVPPTVPPAPAPAAQPAQPAQAAAVPAEPAKSPEQVRAEAELAARQTAQAAFASATQARTTIGMLNEQFTNADRYAKYYAGIGNVAESSKYMQMATELRKQLIDQHGAYAAAATRVGDPNPAVQFLRSIYPGATVTPKADGGIFFGTKDAQGQQVAQNLTKEELASWLNATYNPAVREQTAALRAQQFKFTEEAFKNQLQIALETAKTSGVLRKEAFLEQLKASLKSRDLEIRADTANPGAAFVVDKTGARVGVLRPTKIKVGNKEIDSFDLSWQAM